MKKHRTQCLAYLVANLGSWPVAGATWHIARTHAGYGWVFTKDDGWFLENELTSDRIAEHDYLQERLKVQLSLSPQQNGTFLLRIEGASGLKCYELSIADFAKAVSGQSAQAVFINS